MAMRLKPREIDAQLRTPDLRCAPSNASHRLETPQFCCIRAEAFGNLGTHPRAQCIHPLHMGQLLGDEAALLRTKMTRSCAFQLGQLFAQAPLGEVGAYLALRSSGDQGRQHRSSGGAPAIRGYTGKLPIGPLEQHLAGG
jgi:hypothetical protein